ncbi:hypothetical protein IW492_06825 [Enterococcus sp. BWB1-3]|uniref:TcpE family conjugal transfer membrane protein n=1 Tax=Enterococcus sp. BWB1-3 TaxID=2787713 RepID=UPI00192409BA|nr:TcpE family conjugal transfer membrane protein [Enterococcus sp. BWB1-3]MBL1228944.1 hypothetical protein [Enterococcus sp. BWB1-3]
MKTKELYNYKKALTVPFMIQKLWRGFTLENPVELTKIMVFGVTLLLLLTVFRPVMWLFSLIKGLSFAAYILIPIGAVFLWGKIEPDGLKISVYMIDALFYFIDFKLGKKVINQNEAVKELKELIVFEKI